MPVILAGEETALAAAKWLLESGFYVPPIRYPTVAKGTARLRVPPGTSLYEITLGLDIIPFAKDSFGRNLIIRPELRFDFADDPVFQGESHQYTFAVDAIMKL